MKKLDYHNFLKIILFYFHKHSLHMVFPFENSQTLTHRRKITLQRICYSGFFNISIIQIEWYWLLLEKWESALWVSRSYGCGWSLLVRVSINCALLPFYSCEKSFHRQRIFTVPTLLYLQNLCYAPSGVPFFVYFFNYFHMLFYL